MATLTFKHLNKIYDNNVQAVFDFNLDVKDHEFIVFVGPSGCGKSTTLRMVAGLEEISSGELYIGSDNELINHDYRTYDENLEKQMLFYHQLDFTQDGLTTGEKLKGYDKGDAPIVFFTDRTQIGYKLFTEDNKAHFNKLSLHIEYATTKDFCGTAIISDKIGETENNASSILYFKANETSIDIDFDEFVLQKKYCSLYLQICWPINVGESLLIKSVKIVDNEQRLINSVEPKDRDIAMVFQSYALYPHMTVYNNIAFGLRLRHVNKDIIDQKVTEVGETLGLTPYLKRKPSALSGGQRQRVALGRAIVRSPKVFLMDEPLSNLDAKLRVTMRSEIAKIHEKVGATTIYVTHDQTEAMTMASRIVVMKDGYIQQIGSPRDVYNLPENVFVGSFIGSPAMNFIECSVDFEKQQINIYQKDKIAYSFKPSKEQMNGIKQYFIDKPKEITADIATLTDMIANETNEKILALMNKDMEDFQTELEYYNGILAEQKYNLLLGVRPENIYLVGDAHNNNPATSFNMEADVTELLGHEFIVYGYIGDSRVIVKLGGGIDVKIHTTREYSFDMNLIHFFDPHSSKRLKLENYGVKTYADLINDGQPKSEPKTSASSNTNVKKVAPKKAKQTSNKKSVKKPANESVKKPVQKEKTRAVKSKPASNTIIKKKVVTTVVTTTTSNGKTKTTKTKKVSK